MYLCSHCFLVGNGLSVVFIVVPSPLLSCHVLIARKNVNHLPGLWKVCVWGVGGYYKHTRALPFCKYAFSIQLLL